MINKKELKKIITMQSLYYWVKWRFVVKPKVMREITKAKAKLIDELTSDILEKRIK